MVLFNACYYDCLDLAQDILFEREVNMKRFKNGTPPKILAMVLVFTFLLMTPASATVVSDNLSGWLQG